VSSVQVLVTEEAVEVLLSRWQKIFGLMKDIRVPLANVRDAEVVEDPLHEPMSSGLKIGIRLPWFYYAARTVRLDKAFVVRRGRPALGFDVVDQHPLQRVLVSTPDAAELARRLQRS
jgi:hypothetical protein